MTESDAAQMIADAKKAEEVLAWLAPYLDRMSSAHSEDLTRLIMAEPHKTARIVAQTQAVRNFQVLRGLIERTIAKGDEARQYLKEAERHAKDVEPSRFPWLT